MASNTLSGAGVSPANTKSQILHIGTGTVTNAIIRLGDGTPTPMRFTATGMAIDGTLEALGVSICHVLGADVVATTNTPVGVSAFGFTPVAGAVYLLQLILVAQSVETATGVQIVASGGSGNLSMLEPGSTLGISSITGTYAATSSPAANTNFGIQLSGLFSPTNTTPLAFAVKSENASKAVTFKAGSVLLRTRIS